MEGGSIFIDEIWGSYVAGGSIKEIIGDVK